MPVPGATAEPVDMIRFTGIHVLALGIAVWGLAVWRLDAPDSAATVDTAPTRSELAPAEKPAESDVDASQTTRVETGDTGDTAAPAAPPGPAADAVPETASAAVLPPADPTPPASTAVDPAWAAPRPSDDGAGAERPAVPRDPYAQRMPGGAVPRAPVRPQGRYEYPPAYSMPPARPGSGVSGGGTVVANEFNSARRAAWEGRLADALDHYRAAARIQPDNYDVWGEMGNVLWEMRRWSEAAYALEGAATLLVKAGELQAASDLVPAVGSLDPSAARRIQQLVQGALQRFPG